jgi:hypothetical protein
LGGVVLEEERVPGMGLLSKTCHSEHSEESSSISMANSAGRRRFFVPQNDKGEKTRKASVIPRPFLSVIPNLFRNLTC